MTVPPTRADRSRRTPLIAMLMLLLTALLGAVVGVSLDRRFSPSGDHGPMGPHFGMPPTAFRDRMAGELGLSPTQRESVDSIMDRSFREICTVQDEVQPRLDTLFTRMRREVAQVLTPEQEKKLETFRKKHPRPTARGLSKPECSPEARRGGA